MSWLTRDEKKETLRELLEKEPILPVPGVFNPLSAVIAQKVGFKAVYLSGAAFSASLALPDLGLFTLSELSWMTRYIFRATGMPIIVDVDTGFGEILNVTRTVKEMEETGAAAIQIEDQELPKKCGHLKGKKLIPAEEMVKKLLAARSARKKLLIIARTDARSVYGMDEAIRRAKLYEQTGADIIFPESLESEIEFGGFAREMKVPLLANMTEFGKTPYIKVSRFQELGYKIVIFPVTALRASSKIIEEVFRTIHAQGTQVPFLERLQTRKELYKLIQYYKYEEFDKKISEGGQ